MLFFVLNAIINVLDRLIPTYNLQPVITAVRTPIGYCKFLIGGFTFEFLTFILTAWLIRTLIIQICKVIGKVVLRVTSFLD